LRNEPGVNVELVNGNRGELTVSINGRTVATKQGDNMPTQDEVLAAVRNAELVPGK
jgi:hypothetical protein